MKGKHGAHIKTLYLKPGEMHLTREPSLITTVLGSCISITMHHKATGFSIICHAVMPSRLEARKRDEEGRDIFQYVDSSLEWMLSQCRKNSIKPGSVEVKMFGGAALFHDAKSVRRDLGVGKRNIEIAIEMLKKNTVKLSAWNVGGNQGRKLIFNTLTGEVLVRFISRTNASSIDSGGRK